MPGSSKWSLSFGFLHRNHAYTTPLSIHTTCPAHLIILDLVTRTILGGEYRSLSSSLPSFRHSSLTLSLLGPNILPSTLFSDNLSRCFSINVTDQVSYPYKTKDKIIVLYILNFVFLDNKTHSLERHYWLLECAALYTRLKMSRNVDI